MLVLQLKPDDVIEMWLEDGRTITVQYVEMRSEGRLRLGFTADDGIRIYRQCVADAIRRENHAAAQPVK